jgi:hypothetical protein
MTKSLALAGIILAASVSGCATITRGSSEVLVINTEPVGVLASLSSGHMCKTPCSIELKRKNAVHVKLEKAGYETVDTDVKSEVSGAGGAAMAGNVILGGLIGAGVDAATGAMNRLTPNPLTVKMVPVAAQPTAAAPANAPVESAPSAQ